MTSDGIGLEKYDSFSLIDFLHNSFFIFYYFWRRKNLSCLQKDKKAAVTNQQNFPPKLSFPNPQSFTRYFSQTLVFM